MILYFEPTLFPRTLTRDDWREIWRWKRLTEKALAEARASRAEMLKIAPDFMKQRMLDEIVNPPLLIHDMQGRPR